MCQSLTEEEVLIYRCCLLLDSFLLLKLLPGFLELGLKLVSAFSLWATLLTTSAGWICEGWGQQVLALLKILILAAKSPFATFKIFTAGSLDSHLPLLEENAEAGDGEILLWSFFACPAWGVWRRACPGWRMLIYLCSSCTGELMVDLSP